MANDYGFCKFCGASNVKSPKTGKVFCSKKCWLESQPQEARIENRPTKYDEEQLRKEARREEGLSWGNAKNCASVIVAAMIHSNAIPKDDWETYFKNITQTIFEFDETEM